mmetsp:Transcript_11422/g.27317  ORF Transcript_11422/g.27317 Transcript_11422/m.27317 type:complete len:742 (+) Transcript_11422:49-2274(+)
MLRKMERGEPPQRKLGRNRRKISKERFSLQNSIPKRERSEQDGSPFHARKKSRKRSPPSIEAMELSDKLKKLSREKKLDEALSVYWDSAYNEVRDNHHACIMVDIAARCGNIAVGEKLLEKVAKEGNDISVEMKTALLKGICHSGKIGKAHELFLSMCASKAKSNYPNVRTLNTLLRGCLWCAVTSTKDGSLVGGVVTAEIAWRRFKSLYCKDGQPACTPFDISSYEYSITLLCHALRVDEAIKRISEMKLAFDVMEKMEALASSDDQSLTEGLAMVYCALARAYTILKKEDDAIAACKNSLIFSKASKDALKRSSSFSRKCGWRKHDKRDGDRRTESNSIYRHHRLSEIERESRALMTVSQNVSMDEMDVKVASRDLARRLITRLVFLSGGGTTDADDQSDSRFDQSDIDPKDTSKKVQRDLMNSLYFSYGLAAPIKNLGISMDKEIEILRRKDCNRILGCVGLQGGILKSDGSLDLHRIFSAGIGISKTRKKRRSKSRRVELELGAGFGDWIARKAIQDPSSDFLAVELRADRVAQIFARTAVLSSIKPVDNLCVVGAESGNLLCNHLSNESVNTIYVNHPEPPTQTFGAESNGLISIMNGGQEPAHMLNSKVISAAGKALKKMPCSRFIVVTDNFWYSRLICATIEKVMRQNPSLFRAIDLNEADSSNSFTRVVSNDYDGAGSVLMFKGKPNETIGYPSGSLGEGESYFDRLWQAGAGRHAEIHSRYIIVMSPTSSRK